MDIKSIVRSGVLTAIVYLSMAVLHVSLFGSALHLGSLIIVVISLTFPRKEALFASAIGPTLFDILSGYAIYAPFTFIARLLLSYIVSKTKDKKLSNQLIAAFIGGVVVSVVYFISYIVLLDDLNTALAASIPDLIQLILTLAGVFVAIPLKKSLPKVIK